MHILTTCIHMCIYNHRSTHTYVHTCTWSDTSLSEVTCLNLFKLAYTYTQADVYICTNTWSHNIHMHTHAP